MLNHKFAVVITAAGNSTRFGKSIKKEYLPIENNNTSITVLSEVVCKFLNTGIFSNIIIVVPMGDEEKAKKIVFADTRITYILTSTCKLHFISGSSTRQTSVLKGLSFLDSSPTVSTPDFVLIHDGARPFVSESLINRIAENVIKHEAVAPVIPVTDTQKKVKTNWIEKHLNRSEIKAVQTPQGFNFKKIIYAHEQASKDGNTYTDETEIFATYFAENGSVGKVFTCEGSVKNKKITFAEDLPIQPPTYRIGLGYDLHKLKSGKELILGGVKIKSSLGCDAHSDGDALLHAITDSLLGATGFSDIGELFPPSDDKWKNADSAALLKTAWSECKQNWTIGNIDCVIAIESPKILPYRNEIKNSIADILEIPSNNIFVKAKTGEGIGVIGSKQAVAVWVTSLIYRTCQRFPE